ncbi:hypothetical protein NLM33_17460 [Bradyrhizobium sp. CCGUVB1N3]|uniref:DUF6895 family protein n=1 Tax=Bradyrhizobium sp. CCGUVB1N3 TaxID=2949629 RepID=UPI0020B2F4A7|nr:hypothetical protein [Bradyrhizobium sp. CCGUVB1N3]MCP3472108.1 hypothetical protein [Bradyrhizobium sp. CCGUVB1N3]
MQHLQEGEVAPDLRRDVDLTQDRDFRQEFRQDLRRRLRLAMRIAARTVQFLGEDGFDGSDLPEGNFAAEKPLAETAMLLHIAGRHASHPGIHHAIDALLAELLPYARSQQMHWDVARYPSVCLQLATPHIILSTFGYPDDAFDTLLAQSWSASARPGHEVVPYRELEIGWLLALWLDDPPGPDFAQVARKTALGNAIDLLNGTREDAYAHTHAVMYFTDFGNWQPRLPRPREEFLDESAAVLARALVVEDYDLAAEALMAWPLLSSAWSPAAAFGFRVVASLEDKVGFLPAGRSAASQLLRLSGHDKTKCALATSYHTAYVMGMLCAVALKAGMASPFAIPGSSYPNTLAADLYARIPKTGAHWEQMFEHLVANEQAALAPFLLDVALMQASRRSDAAEMADLLRLAVTHGMANTTLCAQAAEFLARLGALVGGR